jgi:hypothetical protein
LVLVLVFVALHMTLALSAQAAWLSFVSAAAWTIFLPGFFWNYLEKLAGRRASIQETIQRIVGALRKAQQDGSARVRKVLAPRVPKHQMRGVEKTIVVLAMVLVFAGNLSNTPSWKFELPPGMQAVATMAQLGQPRSITIPIPPADDGWYVIEGVLLNGKRVDVWSERSINYAKPADVAGMYWNDKWRLYLTRLARTDMVGYRPYYAGYLCRIWNQHHLGNSRLDQMYINYMLEPIAGSARAPGGPSKVLLLHHSCPK